MKGIFVVRHAKAEDPDLQADIKRALTSRGKMDASAAGRELNRQSCYPELIYCSSAVRTRETLDAISNAYAFPFGVKFVPEFYYEGIEAYLDCIVSTSDDVDTIMFIGHNPSISVLASMLDNQKRIISLGTANMLYFQLDISNWAQFSPGEMLWWFRP